jgi:hypothetical protein
MKHIVLILGLLTLASCKDFDGNFKAKTNLVFKTKKRVFSSKLVKVRVPTGEYNTEINFTSTKKIKIKFAGIDKKIKIKLPEGLNINPSNDEFYINGADVKQDYDFDGKIRSKYTTSDRRRETESCTYTTYRTRCHQECYTNSRGRTVCRNVCSDYPVTEYGWRHVEYYYKYTTTNMRMKVLNPSTSESLGLFKATENHTDRIVTYSSICR